ncbi:MULTISPECIES: D-alanyl-D-alanine carboxypeptidase [Chitinophagaceae]
MKSRNTGAFILTLVLLNIQVYAQKIKAKKIAKLFDTSQISNDHFVGFALYDLDNNKMIYQRNASLHFIPASNTKLFTLYTALNMLGDSVPGIQYAIAGDSLIFWGTGDPSLLHPKLEQGKIFHFLKNIPHKLYFSYSNYAHPELGPDDWRADVSPLPLYGNEAYFEERNGKLIALQNRFQDSLYMDPNYHPTEFYIEKLPGKNLFRYPNIPIPKGFRASVSMTVYPELTALLLSDTLGKKVVAIDRPLLASTQTINSVNSDSLYRHMMLPSDNFLAEQILLLSSLSLSKTELSQANIRQYSKKNFLQTLPDSIQWDDGCGLSRLNLFTPNDIITVLKMIREKLGSEERMQKLFPEGGVSGTLRSAYKLDNGKSFVWAKTGTLTNVHAQSGLVITRKGKRLLYSFQNNNYIESTSIIRGEMGRIITEVHNRY